MNKQVITRAQMEKALVETAWSFFLKGDKLQYESQELNLIGGTVPPPVLMWWMATLRSLLTPAWVRPGI